jgi:hypothetical protein
MKRATFNSIIFYYFLIIMIFALLVYNLYSIYGEYNFITILPILIQIFLLILIFTKHVKVKLALKIWSIIFLIIAPLMQFTGKLLKDGSYDFQFFEIRNYIIPFLMLSIGSLIFYFTEKTIVIEKE